MRHNVQNIIKVINEKCFELEIYEGFESYCYTHILTESKTSILFEVTVKIHLTISEMIKERKEEAIMKAAHTAVVQTDTVKETTK